MSKKFSFTFFSWACIKSGCKAYFTQAKDSYCLIQGQHNHTCKLGDHKTVQQKLALHESRKKAVDGEAKTPQGCYNLLDDE